MGSDHKHRVITYQEAEGAIRSQEVMYINHCFCRTPAKEGKTPYEYCGHKTETCLGLNRPGSDFTFPYREIRQDEALNLFEDWKNTGRLFRFMEDDGWICMCCSCGCEWFRDKDGNRVKDLCDKSSVIEFTDMSRCLICGDCVPSCPYEARSLLDDTLLVDPESCYGCSACEPVCQQQAISMVMR